MSIDRLIRERVFDPETIEIMTSAYERARNALGLSGRTDAATMMLAEAVLSVVESGIRDAERAFQLTLASFEADRN
jgi:hypothetical protein